MGVEQYYDVIEAERPSAWLPIKDSIDQQRLPLAICCSPSSIVKLSISKKDPTDCPIRTVVLAQRVRTCLPLTCLADDRAWSSRAFCWISAAERGAFTWEVLPPLFLSWDSRFGVAESSPDARPWPFPLASDRLCWRDRGLSDPE